VSIGEVVPCAAAGLDDGVVVGEDADREPVGPEVLPDILDRVQLRAVGREGDEGDDSMKASSVGLPGREKSSVTPWMVGPEVEVAG
jgi:hypothetical protein